MANEFSVGRVTFGPTSQYSDAYKRALIDEVQRLKVQRQLLLKCAEDVLSSTVFTNLEALRACVNAIKERP